MFHTPQNDLFRQSPGNGCQLFFQATDTGLHGIIRNNLFQGRILDPELFLRKAMFLPHLRKQMFCGNMVLLCLRIAGNLNHFHPVQQRTRNGIQAVGGSKEEHIRQIVGKIQIMVGKGTVLFRIQHLQQGAGRISAVAPGIQLIHLIQYHNRIGYAG